MPTPSVEQVRAWMGRSMIDAAGKQLGEITDIYLDRETDQPEWAVVRTACSGCGHRSCPWRKLGRSNTTFRCRTRGRWSRTRPTLIPMGSCRRLRKLSSTGTTAWSTTP
jgi:PRC-barrel domain